MTHGLVNVNTSVLPSWCSQVQTDYRSTITNINKYIPNKRKTTTYQKSFLARACRIWNCLADELDFRLVSLTSFKSVLFYHYEASLATCFDRAELRTFKTV